MDWTNFLITIATGGQSFVSRWGYLGIFFISLVSSASIFLPIPTFIIIFTISSTLNPFLVALFASIGATIGETTGYLLGLGGKEILEDKYSKQLENIKKMFKKYGSVFWIIILGVTPLPDDIAGIFCGLIRYDFKKYFLATFIGKIILYLILAYAGYYSLNWVLDYLEPKLVV